MGKGKKHPVIPQRGSRSWRGWALVVALVGVALAFWMLVPWAGLGVASAPEIQRLRVKVLQEYPHDPHSFTQGLLFADGHLYESTGLYQKSSLRKIDLESGRIVERVNLLERFFAEGLAKVNNRLYQLTWKAGRVLVYDFSSLREVDRLGYSGEGWGLTYDGKHLIMSDGSATLSFRDPDNFQLVRRLEVQQEGNPLQYLNELEWVDDTILANVWYRDEIVKIDPESGSVVAIIDAAGLWERQNSDAVLNGIAYVPERKTFLLTGKLWPKVFEVVFE